LFYNQKYIPELGEGNVVAFTPLIKIKRPSDVGH
jgi:hypothetical protein